MTQGKDNNRVIARGIWDKGILYPSPSRSPAQPIDSFRSDYEKRQLWPHSIPAYNARVQKAKKGPDWPRPFLKVADRASSSV
jgi:hypothetical protein